MKRQVFLFSTLLTGCIMANAQQQTAKPEDTEQWSPVPKVVTPGKNFGDPPADATILFDGKSIDQWESVNNPGQPANWNVANGILTVNKKAGNIQTKQSFQDYQLHLEWRVPENITGKDQGRGNSGLFLASTGKGDAGYELQIMDSYNNPTYVNGQAGSIYKQFPPAVNPDRPPGQWNVYDVAWKAPRFNDDGSLQSPAMVTVFFNGVLVQNNVALKGETRYIGQPTYTKHGAAPIKLQAHGDPSEPISFRNIWIRPIQ